MLYNELSSFTPTQRTQNPISTGTSVLGVVYDGGVLIAADQLASYGSLARFRDVPRVSKVNSNIVLGCGGDYADYQFMEKAIEQKVIEEEQLNDGHNLSARGLYSWLGRVQYNKRSKFDPLWCTWLVGGVESASGINPDGQVTPDRPFLGFVDKLGTAFECPIIATGYGAYIATPMMREWQDSGVEKTEKAAKDLIHSCMTVLFCRDARSWPKYDLAKVDKDGASLIQGIVVEADWNVAHYVSGYE